MEVIMKKKLLGILFAALVLPMTGIKTVNAGYLNMTAKTAMYLGKTATKGTTKTVQFIAKDPYMRGIATGLILYVPVRCAVKRIAQPATEIAYTVKNGVCWFIKNPVCTAALGAAITYKLVK